MERNNHITIGINIDGNYEVTFPSGQIAIHETAESISNSIPNWLCNLMHLDHSLEIKDTPLIEKLRQEFPDLILTMEDKTFNTDFLTMEGKIFNTEFSTIRSIFADGNKIVSWCKDVSLECDILEKIKIEIQNYLNAKNENLV